MGCDYPIREIDNIKKCTKCGAELPLEQFYKHRTIGDNIIYHSACKNCARAANRKWRHNNREKHRVANAKWRKSNPEKCRAAVAKWRENYAEKNRMTKDNWRKNNMDYYAEWRRNNKEHMAKYFRDRAAADPTFRMMRNIRNSIYSAIKGNAKSGHAVELLGCSVTELRKHIESLFTRGMTWDKYLNGEIHLDHIIPVSYFDLTDKEQQERCFHYTNLQPLWAADNMRKRNKILEIQLVLL